MSVSLWVAYVATRPEPQRHSSMTQQSRSGLFRSFVRDHGGMVIAGGPRSLSAVPHHADRWNGTAGGALMPFWPYTRPDGIAVAVLIAMAVQLVSPWNEAASLYATICPRLRSKDAKAKLFSIL